MNMYSSKLASHEAPPGERPYEETNQPSKVGSDSCRWSGMQYRVKFKYQNGRPYLASLQKLFRSHWDLFSLFTVLAMQHFSILLPSKATPLVKSNHDFDGYEYQDGVRLFVMIQSNSGEQKRKGGG